MMKRPYTGSAGREILIIFVLLFSLSLLEGQIHHACPHQSADTYENPLNERWLSLYDMKSIYLDLHVSNTSTYLEGSASLLVETKTAMDTLVLELNEALDVSEVFFNEGSSQPVFPDEASLDFLHQGDVLYLMLENEYPPGTFLQVRVNYKGEAGQDRGFFAGITSKRDNVYGHDVTYTLSEPMNAKDWFPVKQVLEDKIDSVTFRLRCDKSLLAGSNGLLTEVEERGDEHILTWKTSYPMAYYLISFAVSEYRDYSFYAELPEEKDSVLVQNYIYDDDRVMEDWGDNIRMTAPLITAFSRLLVDYPFAAEKYGHAMAPMGGGMEHQTMTTIHSFSFFLVAHELAHQWFGDHITCGNWQDIWINEGFASYFEYVAAQELLGQDAADDWMETAMTSAINETEGSVYVPASEVQDTYRLFDMGLTYRKGAVLLHMIRFILDDDPLFFQVMKSYLGQYGNSLATGENFRSVLEEESGTDFSCFFEQWYYGEGHPGFLLHWEQEGDSVYIRSEQSTSAPAITPLFKMSFEIEIRYISGERERFRLMQEKNSQVFSLPSRGWISDILFDPDGHVLATSTVMGDAPEQSAYHFGPNPTSGALHIQFPYQVPLSRVSFTNTEGKKVVHYDGLENPISLDISALIDGPYILEISNDLGTFKEKIVKISSQ